MTAYSRTSDGFSRSPYGGEAVLRLRLIGQMEAWTVNNDSVLPSGRKTRGVLAAVALSAPRPVLRGRLAEMFWSRRPEEQARASLRQEIHRLLEALGTVGSEVLSITRDHLALRPGAVWTDVDEVLRATSAHPEGLSLFDGDLLEDLDGLDPAFDGWLSGERERVGDRARMLAEQLLRQQSEPEPTIAAAQRLLAIDRAHEGAWRALMRAYAARGERGMAIQAFDRCRTVLMEQLDAEPSTETARLGQELRAATIGGVSPSEAGRARLPMPQIARAGAGVGGFAEQVLAIADAPTESRLTSRTAFQPESRALERVEARAEPQPDPRVDATVREQRAPQRTGPVVGVLPLRLVGVAEHEAHLSAGMSDEITNGLARFRWMSLVSSSALARFAAQTRDEAALRRNFELDLLLDGTLQRIGEHLRVSMRLLDLGRGGQVVWSRRFDRDGSDPLAVQDAIAAEIVAQIDPEIVMVECQRASARPSIEPTAYDLMLRAMPLMTRMDRGTFKQAGDLLSRAVISDPDYAQAHAWLAHWHVILVSQGWADDVDASSAAAGRLAERAIVLDPQDAKALTIAGHVRAFLQRRMREAMTLHDRALRLNPNLSMAWVLSAATCCYAGELDEAKRRIDRYKDLSPLDPSAYLYDTVRVMVALLRRENELAANLGREVTEMNPALLASQRLYLSAIGHIGERREAARVREHILALDPAFTVSQFRASSAFQRAADVDHVCEGLRRAGVREG